MLYHIVNLGQGHIAICIGVSVVNKHDNYRSTLKMITMKYDPYILTPYITCIMAT